MTNDVPMLQLQDLVDAVSGTAAALRCRTRLQPAGGAGDKVFPPTYAGAVYAIEHRRVPIKNNDQAESFETVPCVLLDSVQSQANRMEEALQNALDDGRVRIPIVTVDFSPFYPGWTKTNLYGFLMQSEWSPVSNCHTVLQTRSFARAFSVTRPFDRRRPEG